MYDAIASDENYVQVLMDIGRQRNYNPLTHRSSTDSMNKPSDVLDSLRGSRAANERRNAIASAMWTDYVRVLGERGMTVQPRVEGILMDGLEAGLE